MAYNWADETLRFDEARCEQTPPLTETVFQAWASEWKGKATKQGWSLFFTGLSVQVQKLDVPKEWGDDVPEWDSDLIAFGLVYHGTEPLHLATKEFLKTHAPKEWAFIEGVICNGTTDT